jgi:sulfite exporter TauE/SafE
MTTALLLSIFLATLVSGWHCALMCGGIAVAIENPVRLVSKRRLALEQLFMHLGRISTYALLGALAGMIGATLWRQEWLPIQRAMFALAASLLIFQGVIIWRRDKPVQSQWEAWLAARTAIIWQFLTNKIVRRGQNVRDTLPGRWLAGMVWGLVPCGLVYGVLPFAFLAGNGWIGASVMLAFGLGTLPNLLLISGFSARLAQSGHRPWARHLAAGLMAGTGTVGLYHAITLSDAMLRGGFCVTH